MIISVSEQLRTPGLPLRPGSVYVDSSLPVAVVGVPPCRADGRVVGVSVTVVNADGMPVTAPCVRCGCVWRTAFAPSNFETVGFVRRGLKVDFSLETTDGRTLGSTVGVGDFEVLATAANATPGDPARTFVSKGSDIYVKSEVVDEVQHYKKIVIENNQRVGWGFNLVGDYVLVNGEFQEVE